MTFKYPNVLKAMERAEYDRWGIGDALVGEIQIGNNPNPGDVHSKLIEAQKEAAENGYEYKLATLRSYRDTSRQFTHNNRLPNVSMDVHITCGTPERLRVVNTAWQNDPASRVNSYGKPLPEGEYRPLPRSEARRIIGAIEEERVITLAEKLTDKDNDLATKLGLADAAVSQAQDKLEDAKNTLARATDKQQREQAEAAVTEAQKAIKQEQKIRSSLLNLPKPNPNFVPDPQIMPRMILLSRLRHKAEDATRLAEETLAQTAALDDYELTEAGAGVLLEAVQTAVNNWERCMRAIRMHVGEELERSHLMIAIDRKRA